MATVVPAANVNTPTATGTRPATGTHRSTASRTARGAVVPADAPARVDSTAREEGIPLDDFQTTPTEDPGWADFTAAASDDGLDTDAARQADIARAEGSVRSRRWKRRIALAVAGIATLAAAATGVGAFVLGIGVVLGLALKSAAVLGGVGGGTVASWAGAAITHGRLKRAKRRLQRLRTEPGGFTEMPVLSPVRHGRNPAYRGRPGATNVPADAPVPQPPVGTRHSFATEPTAQSPVATTTDRDPSTPAPGHRPGPPPLLPLGPLLGAAAAHGDDDSSSVLSDDDGSSVLSDSDSDAGTTPAAARASTQPTRNPRNTHTAAELPPVRAAWHHGRGAAATTGATNLSPTNTDASSGSSELADAEHPRTATPSTGASTTESPLQADRAPLPPIVSSATPPSTAEEAASHEDQPPPRDANAIQARHLRRSRSFGSMRGARLEEARQAAAAVSNPRSRNVRDAANRLGLAGIIGQGGPRPNHGLVRAESHDENRVDLGAVPKYPTPVFDKHACHGVAEVTRFVEGVLGNQTSSGRKWCYANYACSDVRQFRMNVAGRSRAEKLAYAEQLGHFYDAKAPIVVGNNLAAAVYDGAANQAGGGNFTWQGIVQGGHYTETAKIGCCTTFAVHAAYKLLTSDLQASMPGLQVRVLAGDFNREGTISHCFVELVFRPKPAGKLVRLHFDPWLASLGHDDVLWNKDEPGQHDWRPALRRAKANRKNPVNFDSRKPDANSTRAG